MTQVRAVRCGTFGIYGKHHVDDPLPHNGSERELLRSSEEASPVSTVPENALPLARLRSSCIFLSRALWAANFFRHAVTFSVSFNGTSLSHNLPIPSVYEREIKIPEQRTCLFIIMRGRAYHNVHTPKFIDRVVIDFGENNLFLDTHRVIATAVETLWRQSLKSRTRGSAIFTKTINKFVHSIAAQCDLDANRHPFTQLERRNRFASAHNDRLLAGDDCHIASHCRPFWNHSPLRRHPYSARPFAGAESASGSSIRTVPA